uniref:RNA-binding protein 5-A (Trinotate prediction) n=1 Tax=Myxobolus squamalis TaxID=59785 RepID=A0A6B2G1I4_MYXSQ
MIEIQGLFITHIRKIFSTLIKLQTPLSRSLKTRMHTFIYITCSVEPKAATGIVHASISKEKNSKPIPNDADKISCDMERWAKRVNQETSIKNITKKQHIHEVQDIQKKTLELKEKIDAQELFNTLSSTPCNSINNNDKLLLDQTLDNDPHLSLPDLVCLLCQRKFSSKEVLIKHVTSSNLHMTNLQNASKI